MLSILHVFPYLSFTAILKGLILSSFHKRNRKVQQFFPRTHGEEESQAPDPDIEVATVRTQKS